MKDVTEIRERQRARVMWSKTGSGLPSETVFGDVETLLDGSEERDAEIARLRHVLSEWSTDEAVRIADERIQELEEATAERDAEIARLQRMLRDLGHAADAVDPTMLDRAGRFLWNEALRYSEAVT